MAPHQPIRKQPGGHRPGKDNRPPVAAPPATIPDKLYFRIGEVARLCDVPAYVLRFWETEFPQLKPNKGGTGQRLFRRRDVETALRIKCLLYDEGYTIPGARQLLKAEGKQKEPQLSLLVERPASDSVRNEGLRRLRQEVLDLLTVLERPLAQQSAARKTSPQTVPSPGPSRRTTLTAVLATPTPVTPTTDRLFELHSSPSRESIPDEEITPERPRTHS